MKRVERALLLGLAPLILFVVSYSQDAGEPERTESSRSQSVVRGRVIYQDSGLPVRRVFVSLVDISEERSDKGTSFASLGGEFHPGETVLTDDSGTFEILGLSGGTYYPYIHAPNILNPNSVNRYFGRDMLSSVRRLADYFEKIELNGMESKYLELVARKGSIVSGTVTYSDGSPVTFARVELVRKPISFFEDKEVRLADTVTDHRGNYEFTELLPGEYFVKVILPAVHSGQPADSVRRIVEDSELVSFYPSSVTFAAAEALSVGAGIEINSANVLVPERDLVTLSGTVVGRSSQRPLSDASLKIERIPGPEEGRQSNGSKYVRSNFQGQWAFKDLPEGKYKIITKPSTSTYEGNDAYGADIRIVELTKEENRDLKIELPPAASVSGRLTVEGGGEVPYLTVVMVDYDQKFYEEIRSPYRRNDDQRNGQRPTHWDFKVTGLPGGKFTIRVSAGPRYAKEVRIDNKLIRDRTISLAEGQSLTDLAIVLSKDIGSVGVTVKDRSDNLVEGILVAFVPTEPSLREAFVTYTSGSTGFTGYLELNVPAGEYFLVLKRPSFRLVGENDWIEDALLDAPKITVSPDELTKITIPVPD